MNKQRFFIDTQGNNYQAYREAILLACKLADSNPAIKKIILLVQAKQNSVVFSSVFNDQVEKKLSTVGTTFDNYKTLVKIETLSTYKNSNQPEIVITCMLKSEDVFLIDDFYNVEAIIAVPWLKNDVEKWAKTWGAMDINTQQNATVYPLPSCITVKALEHLTESINFSNNILNPNDDKTVKTYIRALKKYEPSFNENIIRAYLVRELGLSLVLANTIADLIITLNEGRSFKGGDTTGLKDYYNMWKEECLGQP